MLIAIQIDVVVVVIDRVHESSTFMHFVGMPIAPCFKGATVLPCPQIFPKLSIQIPIIQSTSAEDCQAKHTPRSPYKILA